MRARLRASEPPIRIRPLDADAVAEPDSDAGPCPLALLDFDRDPLAALRCLERWRQRSPGGLTLILNPRRLPELAIAARELGATQVWSGPAPPPLVAEILTRWARIAVQRSASFGWLDRANEDNDMDEDEDEDEDDAGQGRGGLE